MGNYIFHSIKHIKYEVIRQNIILFNFKKITIGYTIYYHNVNNVFNAEIVCRRKFK